MWEWFGNLIGFQLKKRNCSILKLYPLIVIQKMKRKKVEAYKDFKKMDLLSEKKEVNTNFHSNNHGEARNF